VCVAVCCSVLQCVAVRCSVLKYLERGFDEMSKYFVLQYVAYAAVFCSVLQCAAVCC